MSDSIASVDFNVVPSIQGQALSLPQFYYGNNLINAATQSGHTVFDPKAAFTASMLGGLIIFASNTTQEYVSGVITSVVDGRTLTVGSSQNITSPLPYIIWYGGVQADQFGNIGFQNSFTSNIFSNSLILSSVAPYSVGTISQSGNILTGAGGPTFTSDQCPGIVVFADGTTSFVTAIASPTTLFSPVSKTVASTTYEFYTSPGTFADNLGNLGVSYIWPPQTQNILEIGGSLQVQGTSLLAGIRTLNSPSKLVTYPGNSLGSFQFKPTENSGDFDGIVTNAALGQATTWTLGDPVSATSNIVQAPAALVEGNLVTTSGTAGLIADFGATIKAHTFAYGGGSTNVTITANGLTASAVVDVCLKQSTTPASVIYAVAGTNVINVTLSADPGTNTILQYIAITAPV